MGMIARDSMRVCLGARSGTQEGMVNPKTVEVMATLCAMQFSKKRDSLKYFLKEMQLK
jgi:hypothetical protein